jgi:hypothetical protein
MAKSYYRAVILVLASEGALYNAFKNIYTKYMFSNYNIKVYFVYAGNVSFVPQEYDLIYPELKECVVQPHPTKKVVRALQYINSVHDYDFLIRTNLSTFWVFDKLLNRLNMLPTTKTVSGRIGYFSPKYVVGFDMVVTKDLVDILVDNPAKAYFEHTGKYIPEDRILSEFFTNRCGAQILDAQDYVQNIENSTSQSLYKDSEETLSCIDHFRVKNVSDRSLDLKIHEILLNRYYKK